MDKNWREEALCRDAPSGDLRLFFGNEEAQLIVIDQYCRECPVLEECLEYDLQWPFQIGAYGGLTDVQRTSLKNKRRKAA